MNIKKRKCLSWISSRISWIGSVCLEYLVEYRSRIGSVSWISSRIEIKKRKCLSWISSMNIKHRKCVSWISSMNIKNRKCAGILNMLVWNPTKLYIIFSLHLYIIQFSSNRKRIKLPPLHPSLSSLPPLPPSFPAMPQYLTWIHSMVAYRNLIKSLKLFFVQAAVKKCRFLHNIKSLT